MNIAVLKDAADLADKIGHVFIATADVSAAPHVTAAEKLELAGDNCVDITEWFCPLTISNLQKNTSISIVVWAPDGDRGYQLLGKLEKMHDQAVLDGFSAEIDAGVPSPQVERRITVRVGKILDFSVAPHSDIEG